MTEMTTTSCCSNCRQECKPLRCTACKSVSYCSRSCQKSHWKAIHSQSCTREFYTYTNSDRSKKKKKVVKKDGSAGGKEEKKEEKEEKVLAAARELNSILAQMSLEDMKEHYDKSIDQIAFEKMAEKKKDSGADAKKSQSSGGIEVATRNQVNVNDTTTMKSKSTVGRKTISSTPNMERTQSQQPTQHSQHNTTRNNHLPSSSRCEFTVEKLIFTSSYNITVLLPSSILSSLELSKEQHNHIQQYIQINIQNNISSNTTESSTCFPVRSNVQIILLIPNHIKREIKNSMINIASIDLPDTILSSENHALSSLTIYHDDDDNKDNNQTTNQKDNHNSFMMFRLQYDNETDTFDNHIDHSKTMQQLTNVNALNNVQCRFCHQYLRIPATTTFTTDSIGGSNKAPERTNTDDITTNDIRSVCHLPNGYWDEITDYLTCYEGVSYN